MVLNLILILVGAITVYSFPLNPFAITVGMFFLAIAILSIALQVYFPPRPKQVILKVEEPVSLPKKSVKEKVVKKAKKRVRKIKRAKKPKRTRKTRKKR